MAIDDRDERDREAPGATPATEQNAVRGAYVARQGQAATPGGAGAGEAGPDSVRGAYLSRLTRETRGRSAAVVGSEETGATVLRSIYAARTVTVEIMTPRRAKAAPAKKAAPMKKAAPAKKARPAPKAKAKAAAKRKAAPSAAARPAKRKKAAPARAVRKAAPVRAARKAARKAKTSRRR